MTAAESQIKAEMVAFQRQMQRQAAGGNMLGKSQERPFTGKAASIKTLIKLSTARD